MSLDVTPNAAGSGSDVVEDLPSRGPHSVVAVIGHPLAASGQSQMAINTQVPSVSSARLGQCWQFDSGYSETRMTEVFRAPSAPMHPPTRQGQRKRG